MISSILFAFTLTQWGPYDCHTIRQPYVYDGATRKFTYPPPLPAWLIADCAPKNTSLSQPPARERAHVKPVSPPVVVVEAPKPSPYNVEAIRGLDPPRLPKGYPKDLQGQFPQSYRRHDQ